MIKHAGGIVPDIQHHDFWVGLQFSQDVEDCLQKSYIPYKLAFNYKYRFSACKF